MSKWFPLVLFLATIIAGVIWLLDIIFFAKRRKKYDNKESLLVKNAKSFFPILLVVLLIRSFLIEPFLVPTGSLEPTILTREFILVNKFAYGLRLPIIHTKILSIGEPKRGDIAVFRFPGNPQIDFIKRVIGLPGDHIVYKDKKLYVNGKIMPQAFIKNTIDSGEGNVPVEIKKEDLAGVKHLIYIRKNADYAEPYNITVPKNMYFMMGDNRDGSIDSRYWGFVPESYLQGKAFLVWLSWDSQHYRIRWSRLGTVL